MFPMSSQGCYVIGLAWSAASMEWEEKKGFFTLYNSLLPVDRITMESKGINHRVQRYISVARVN